MGRLIAESCAIAAELCRRKNRQPAEFAGWRDKDEIIPNEYRGQPIECGQTFKVETGDWLQIPPAFRHDHENQCGRVYPSSLVR
jgi:hypothetical protein